MTYARILQKCFQELSIDAEMIYPYHNKDLSGYDLFLFICIGCVSEYTKSNEKVTNLRFENLDKYYGKKPFIAVIHDIYELSYFRKSVKYFQEKIFDCIVFVTKSQNVINYVCGVLKSKKHVSINHPFYFDGQYLQDKRKYDTAVASAARFTNAKKIHIVMDIALKSSKKYFLYGNEKGIYWYRMLSMHGAKNVVKFMGSYVHYLDPYQDCAFGIDLTLFHKHGVFDGMRDQYTTLEGINCGVIPICFDVWRYPNGFDAVWLDTPKADGRSLQFEIDRYAGAIDTYKYSFDIAQSNYHLMKEFCDPLNVALQYRKLFQSISGA